MLLIVGLGNYGPKYEKNRHNVGFTILDAINQYLIEKLNLSTSEILNARFNSNSKFKGELSNIDLPDINDQKQKLIMLKPSTYMNNSGVSVSSVVNFYKIPQNKILVIHDDIDLALGRIKIKNGGGDGGNNGIKSIDASIGKNYNRLRFGIGRPENKEDVANYVLGNFTSTENKILEAATKKICSNTALLLTQHYEKFVQEYSL